MGMLKWRRMGIQGEYIKSNNLHYWKDPFTCNTLGYFDDKIKEIVVLTEKIPENESTCPTIDTYFHPNY